MPKRTVESRTDRLQDQLTKLQARVAAPDAISRKQVVDALQALQESLQDLEVAEAELAQQNEELMAVQEALELERHRYRKLFELAPVAYLVTDVRGTVQDANPAASELLGCSRKALIGKPLPALVREADRQAARRLIQNLQGRQEAELGFQSLSPRALRITVATVQRDEDRPGRPATLRWVLRDVTERRAAENALRSTEERLRHSQKLEAVGRLAGGVAHSFNNLLAAIALHAELLIEVRGSPEELRRHAEEIQKAGERAAALARQLLAFGRKQVLQLEPLNVNRQIAALEPVLKRLVGADVALETRLDPDAGWIYGDLGQLEQVLLNLVVNARDAMPDGGRLCIETAMALVQEPDGKEEQGLVPGGYVQIVVSDTGTGMDKEALAHLFEPFFTTKERDKGSGLGLATVYGIVRQSGGDVRVWTAPGEGSRFSLYLPKLDRLAAEKALPVAPQEESSGTEVILFVEDEENIRAPAKEILESRGYAVLAAQDGPEALRISRQHNGQIDLLVSDMVMPGMNGSQLAETLCQERPHLRVLLISGYSEDAVGNQGVLPPQRSFLQKPFPPGVLLRKVRGILDGGDECSVA